MSFFFRFCFCCDTQDGFAVFCVRGNGGVCLGINDVFHQCFHGTFPYTCHTQDFGNESIFLFFLQIRFYLIFKHGHSFLRRTGQHGNDFAVFLHDDAGGSAVVIVKDNAVFLGYHSLLPIVFCHGSACAFEIFFDSAQCSFIQHQFFPEIFCRCFFCQVIFCRPKSTCGDNQVRTGKCLKNGIFQTFGVIPHHCLKINFNAKLCQFFGQILGICIQNISQQDLRSHCNDFCFHFCTSKKLSYDMIRLFCLSYKVSFASTSA